METVETLEISRPNAHLRGFRSANRTTPEAQSTTSFRRGFHRVGELIARTTKCLAL